MRGVCLTLVGFVGNIPHKAYGRKKSEKRYGRTMAIAPTFDMVRCNGVQLAVWDWPGTGTPLIFAHATGFHSRCWDAVIAHFPDRRCIALDLRGHGRSDKPAPPYDLRDFGVDVAALLVRRGIYAAVAIGHSLGGHAVTLAAALAPQTIARLVLIDPALFARERYRVPMNPGHFTAKRRQHWDSPDEMFERFAVRAPFCRWDGAVLRDYCAYGLLPASDGDGFVLACAPEIEADIYRASMVADIYDEIRAVVAPTLVVRLGASQPPGAWDMDASPTAVDLASYFPNARDVHIPEHSHFLPMESPERAAWCIRVGLGDGGVCSG